MGKDDRTYLPMYSLHSQPIVPYRPLGLVIIHKTEGMGFFRDFFARLRDFAGGTVRSYGKSAHNDLIFPALRELSNQAHDLYTTEEWGPPDAIFGLVVDVQSVSSKNMAMMHVTTYGTAIRYLSDYEEAYRKLQTSVEAVA